MTADDESPYRAAIQGALDDVNSQGLSGVDRAVVLGVTLAARLGLALAMPAGVVHPGTTIAAGDSGGPGGLPPKAADLLGKIGSVTKLDAETVELIWDAQGDELGYVVSAKKLASNKAEATRQLAKIVVLGRQAAGLEDWTPSGAIREVANEYGKFDSANFASHLAGLDKDNAVLFRGKGPSREIKLTRSGIESFADALRALVAS